jgi:hypothetical protein
VYQRARLLLAVACPVGSLVALWQLSILMADDSAAPGDDLWLTAVAVLFVWRAVSGVLQTVGVLILNTVEPANRTTLLQETRTLENDAALEAARVSAARALYAIFFPTIIAYVLASALSGNCSAPMISPMLPPMDEEACMAADMDIMLMQNLPGLGVFFHFGMVLVLFSFDGIQRSVPSYKPSLALATLCAGHLSFLICADLIWDIIQTQVWSSLSTQDLILRVLLILWSLSAGYLALCLHRLWKLRLQPR